jgi:hypothetical protein
VFEARAKPRKIDGAALAARVEQCESLPVYACDDAMAILGAHGERLERARSLG